MGPFCLCILDFLELFVLFLLLTLTHSLADKDGRLTGSEAVSFFSMSQLPREVLKKVGFFMSFADGIARFKILAFVFLPFQSGHVQYEYFACPGLSPSNQY